MKEASPTRVRFGVLAFACILSLLTYLDRICIMRVSEDIQRDLSISEQQMGLVFSAFLLGYALFEVPGGWMGDRWGSRCVIAGIVMWWSLFTALSGSVPAFNWGGTDLKLFGWNVPLYADGFMLMLLVRFLFGFGEAGAYPNLARVVGAWFPFGERAFAQGSIWMCARLGGAVAPFIFGRLMTWLGWREAFWILGLFGIALSVFFYLWFRNTPEEKESCNAAERAIIREGPYSWKADSATAGHVSPPWRKLVFSTNLWAICLAAFGVSFGWYFYATWQPKYLKDVFGIKFEDSEIQTGLPYLFGAMGAFIGGSLSDWLVRKTGSRRWGRSLLGVTGFTGAGTCMLFTGYARSSSEAVALFCLASFLSDLAIPVIWAVSTDIGGRYAATVAGIMNTAGGIGAFLSPNVAPLMKRLDYGWIFIFSVLALGWYVAALAWLRIDASEQIVTEEEKIIPRMSAGET